MSPRSVGRWNGPRLLVAISGAIALMSLALAIAVSPQPAAAGAVVRWTARTSLVLFALAYVARPLVQLRPTPLTKALLARRKWLGLSFAASHGFHLAGIVWLASPDVGAFIRARDPTTLFAAATFLLLGAMAITSVESVKRAMPGKIWKRLHWTGMQFSWVSFTTTYATAIGASLLYAIPAALLLAIAGVRAAAWARGRRLAFAQSARRSA